MEEREEERAREGGYEPHRGKWQRDPVWNGKGLADAMQAIRPWPREWIVQTHGGCWMWLPDGSCLPFDKRTNRPIEPCAFDEIQPWPRWWSYVDREGSWVWLPNGIDLRGWEADRPSLCRGWELHDLYEALTSGV